METVANVRIIPAKQQVVDGKPQFKRLNVAAYCRVSTEQEEQQNSYENQIEYYTNYISSNPEWALAGIFADEGISGTQTKNRTEFIDSKSKAPDFFGSFCVSKNEFFM